MEKEAYFSGYCRTMDSSRMVCALRDGEALLDVDCSYTVCPYTAECTVARRITEFLKENDG